MPQNFVSRYNNLLAVKGRGGIEYTAGPNIDISDYIISGRDWTSDIDSAIQSVKGSGFSAATAWVDSQEYLTAHQDVDNLPYVQNSALEFYGVHISGISGSGLYAQSAEGAFTAETANFAYHSETSDSANYAESAGITDSANYALTAFFANSATSSLMADTAVYAYTADKADDLTNWTYTDSAMTGIKGYNGTAFISQDLQYWDYTDSAQTAISGYNGTAFLGEDGNCPWISGNKVIGAITADFGNTVQVISSFDFSGNKNHYISLKGFNLTLPSTAHIASALDDKLPISSFSSYTANASDRMDGIFQLANSAYTTAVNNFYNKADISAISSWSGDINYISGEFTAFTATATGLAIEYTAGDNIDITNHVISGKNWLPTIESGLSSKLDSTASGNFVTSGDVTGTAQYALTTAGWTEVTGGSGPITGGMELSAGNGISITDDYEANKTVIAVSGDYVYNSAYTSYTANADTASYKASTNINITNHYISGKSWTTEIQNASSYAYNQATAKDKTYDVVAGANINVSTASNTFTVSGKDWGSTISAASAYAAAQATGKEYTGIAPIVVNNTTDQISADCTELIAGNGIEFVTAATSTTINCTATGGGASVHYYIDTPNEHTSADIELTIQTSANVGGRYDRWLMNSGSFIGALIPSADTVDDAGKVLTVTAGSPRWQSLPATPSGALGIKVLAVATSAAATAGDADTLYIVTGS